MDDAEWKQFRLHDERKSLLIEIGHALDRVPGVEAGELDDEFSRCLDRGGLDAVYAFTEEVAVVRLPVFYPLVTDHFICARLGPANLTKPRRKRRAKRLLELAEAVVRAGITAHDLPDAPRWCTSWGASLGGFAEQLVQLAQQDIAIVNAVGPGRSKEVSTSFALGLDALFQGRKLSTTKRCALIAGVVSAFVEPITGEQVRQRLKDIRRRPPAGRKR